MSLSMPVTEPEREARLRHLWRLVEVDLADTIEPEDDCGAPECDGHDEERYAEQAARSSLWRAEHLLDPGDDLGARTFTAEWGRS